MRLIAFQENKQKPFNMDIVGYRYPYYYYYYIIIKNANINNTNIISITLTIKKSYNPNIITKIMTD